MGDLYFEVVDHMCRLGPGGEDLVFDVAFVLAQACQRVVWSLCAEEMVIPRVRRIHVRPPFNTCHYNRTGIRAQWFGRGCVHTIVTHVC